MENEKWKMENIFGKLNFYNFLQSFSLCLCVSAVCILSFAFAAFAQTETPPAPAAPRPVKIPNVWEKTLPNGLKIVVVERKNVPLVTASLLIRNGANMEDDALAGVADMTASLLLKGTKTRTATQIAEEIEFLGGNINSGASWTSSNVSVNVTSDKLDKALAIMADTVLNPAFAQKEIDLYKAQTLDELNVQLKQPTTLASFAAARYTFGEHSAFGTPETIAKIKRSDIANFYNFAYVADDAVLIFAGDISMPTAEALSRKYFGVWKKQPKIKEIIQELDESPSGTALNQAAPNVSNTIGKILVVDLPNSGQAAVTYAKRLDEGRIDVGKVNNGRVEADKVSKVYYPALVSNSILGGDFSARLNQEIRIKQGLSYGASSNFTWRQSNSNFLARAQTKNVSAAKVAELIMAEIEKITTGAAPSEELVPRKANLTGKFGRSLETTNGLAAQIGELYLYGLKPSELTAYSQNVQTVTDAQVKNFALNNLKGGDIIIVGDAKIFMDDLKKRFPNQKIEVIPASQLDLNSNILRKN